ncbi:ankyrin repeat [Cedratvirus lausannensis]|uniref:Ankyrin repeat n=1 Tax=Cedratvirus lausannensis TaxID=2023205 RepID=A0A285PX33_9VIRU|nr:ankyrin repeat [Cedratvirus lausannensis]
MLALPMMQNVYRAIFSSSGGRNFVHRWVCSEFRGLIPEVNSLLYLDILLEEGKKPKNFTPSVRILEDAFRMDLAYVVKECAMFMGEDMCLVSARENKPKILAWAAEQPRYETKHICRQAAYEGHLEIIKWARSKNYFWDARTCSNAAFRGHLEIIKWARENGCDWNEETCSSAANRGHLHVLEWVRANGCPWNEETCYSAVTRRGMKVLQ